jgi:hypothetical protein
MDGMRAEEQIVEGEVEEREGLGAQAAERGIGLGAAVEGDDGVQKSSCVRL